LEPSAVSLVAFSKSRLAKESAMEFFASCAWGGFVIWLIARAMAQRDAFEEIARSPPPQGLAPRLLVIVPARNEAEKIERCALSLANQNYPADRLRLLVVDDCSEDATYEIIATLARSNAQIGVVTTPPLPLGWIGKSHACWIGANIAAQDVEWLCFIDADVEAQPDLISSAVAHACNKNIDLLSLAPRHEMKSFAERLILPCGLYWFAFWQDLRKLQSVDAGASVTGQFMLVHREDYEAVGGHAAIRDEICEDAALARLFKNSGRRIALCDGARLLSTRMYSGWATLWPGLTKNLAETLGGPLPSLAAAGLALAIASVALAAPLADGALCSVRAPWACMGLAPALAGTSALVGLHLAGARFFRIPLWYGLLFPIGYVLGAALAIDSVRRRVRRRVHWKGRVYP
jgi:chlorobactene glucosyltransferase